MVVVVVCVGVLYSLQQGLGLACGVVGTEVLVLLHLFLQGEDLALQLTAQPRQSVPDVVGQLLRREREREGDTMSEGGGGREKEKWKG